MPGSVDRVIEGCHERWRRGAQQFSRLLQPAMASRRPQKKVVIRSAIYGHMEFSPQELLFIDSFYLQRLRHVSQMGLLHLVYPDARHSRFEHSLGVLHSLKSLLEADDDVRKSLKQAERLTLYVAALLHDCGHGPFSHTTESLLELSGLDLTLRRHAEGESKSAKPHERRCRDMIQDSDFHLANLGIGSYGLRDALELLDVDPLDVVNIVLGTKPSILLNLLSGDFDVDKMDYFRRDAFFTGTMGGGVDMEVMQRWVRIFSMEGYPTACYDSRLVGHLLHMLYSREHVYNITAFHPVARVAAALLMVAGDLALRSLKPEMAALIFANIELLDDRELMQVLEMAAADADSDEAPLLRRAIQRLYLRRLPKRLFTLSREQFASAFAEALPLLEGESGALPQLAYCRVSDIGRGRYVSLLDHSTSSAVDDIAILEMTPCIGPVDHGCDKCDKEMDTLKRLLIKQKDSAEPITLTEWLEQNGGKNAGDAQARALRAYKLSTWKALVLVPASLRLGLQERGQAEQFLADFARALSEDNLSRPMAKTRGPWSGALKLVADRVKNWRNEKKDLRN